MYGKIYMVNEEEELRKMIVSGINTVAITDDAESFKFTPVLVASILLPPYESVEADSMGNVEQAHNMYVGWLSQPSCMKCLVTIVTALSLGKDIGLYIPFNESKVFSFGRTLIGFMNQAFGIQIADGCGYGFPLESSVNMSPEAEAGRLNAMFVYEAIDFFQFARLYPDGILPSDFVSNKIANLYGGNFSSLDINGLRTFAMNYIARVKQGAKENRFVPIMRV